MSQSNTQSQEDLTVLMHPTVTLDLHDGRDCAQSDQRGAKTVRRASTALLRAALLRGREAARDRSGAAAVEFALVLPFLLTMLLGIIQFGITLNNYLELTNAVRTGARELAVGRTSTTPYTTATAAITSSAANLTAGSISYTLSVNGTACNSDSSCKTALSTASLQPATVTATYPCSLTVMGVNFLPGCTLTSTTTDMIE